MLTKAYKSSQQQQYCRLPGYHLLETRSHSPFKISSPIYTNNHSRYIVSGILGSLFATSRRGGSYGHYFHLQSTENLDFWGMMILKFWIENGDSGGTKRRGSHSTSKPFSLVLVSLMVYWLVIGNFYQVQLDFNPIHFWFFLRILPFQLPILWMRHAYSMKGTSVSGRTARRTLSSPDFAYVALQNFCKVHALPETAQLHCIRNGITHAQFPTCKLP